MGKLTDEIRDFFTPHAITQAIGMKLFTKWLIQESKISGLKTFNFLEYGGEGLKLSIGEINLSQFTNALP